jgi:hypothetical protein
MHHIRSIVMIGREDPHTVGAVREPPLRMHRIQPIVTNPHPTDRNFQYRIANDALIFDIREKLP